MINRLLRFCLENTFIVLIITLLVIGSGYYCIKNIPVDAIPDISENQSIVFTDWPGRDPQTVEDQVTYPLTTSLEGVPGVKVIRSYSGFGFSVVYVIFKDNVDRYIYIKDNRIDKCVVKSGILNFTAEYVGE